MRKKQTYLMAMVLGTALAAMPGNLNASTELSERALSNIERYCITCWRNAHLPPDRWDDCTQEVLRRLLERVPMQRWMQLLAQETEERREFLRAIDTVKKRHQRDRLKGNPLPDALADTGNLAEDARHDEIDAVREVAGELLTDRQQKIIQKTLEGYSVRDIAMEMNMSADRASDEKYKAIQRLRKYFQSHPEWV